MSTRAKNYWYIVTHAKSLRELGRNLRRALQHVDLSVVCELPAAKAPLVSFLHRIDDRRVTDYYDSRLERDDPQTHLEMIREILRPIRTILI